MEVALFSRPGETQTQNLCAALNALRPGCARAFDLALPETERVSLDAAAPRWNGTDLTQVRAAWLHGFAYRDPVIPSGNLEVDWSLWRFDYLEEQQKYSFLHSFFVELARRGVQVFNPPNVHRLAFMKPFLLERLRRSGFRVPEIVCTNRMDVAQEFCRSAGRAIWRPCTGRAAYQHCLDAQREALFSLQRPPVLLASIVEGPMVRGYLYQGQPLLLLHFSPPRMGPQELLEDFWELQCPALHADFARLAETLQAPWMEVFFVLREGQAWYYDVETDPLYDNLPSPYVEKLTGLLARGLLGLDPAAIQGEPLARAQRPAMFLRRMLQVLFEVEDRKYE